MEHDPLLAATKLLGMKGFGETYNVVRNHYQRTYGSILRSTNMQDREDVENLLHDLQNRGHLPLRKLLGSSEIGLLSEAIAVAASTSTEEEILDLHFD